MCTRDKQAVLFWMCDCCLSFSRVWKKIPRKHASHTPVTCPPPSIFTSTLQLRHNELPAVDVNSRQPTLHTTASTDEEDEGRFAAETSDPSRRCQVSRTTPAIHPHIIHLHQQNQPSTPPEMPVVRTTESFLVPITYSMIPHKHACNARALFLLSLRPPTQGGLASLRHRRARIASSTVPTIVRLSVQAEHSTKNIRATVLISRDAHVHLFLQNPHL